MHAVHHRHDRIHLRRDRPECGGTLDAQWPDRDRQAWEQALHTGDFLADGGMAADWSTATRRSALGAYARWLVYRTANGLLDPGCGPAERMTSATMLSYVGELRKSCASVTVASYVAVLSMTIQAMVPDADWRWLRTMQAGLQRRASPVRNKRRRIVPAPELLAPGLDLMTDAEAETNQTGTSVSAALRFRDGFTIALLASRPLRQKTFVFIEIGRHLVSVGDGYVLRFPAEETKVRRALEFSFPDGLLPALRQYLSHYRPHLLALKASRGKSRQDSLPDAGNLLWVTQYGTRFSPSTQNKALKKHTTMRFGRFVNAHLFRDCAASSVATDDPEHVGITAQLLGHTSFQATERYYIQAQSHVAKQLYHDQVMSIRRAAKKTGQQQP